jgi:hypothetical protein
MKLATLLLCSVALAGTAFAGPVDYGKGGKGVVPPPPPPAECFGPGFDIGFFGGGYLPAHKETRDDGLGGGVLFEYFFNEYVGIQASYGAFAPSPTHHVYGGDLVLRYPFQEACVAPYLLVGGGGVSNSDNFGYWDLGGGLEFRFPSMNHVAIFADGAYHWCKDHEQNFTLVRLGVKFPF